jgi:hypothetical protein
MPQKGLGVWYRACEVLGSSRTALKKPKSVRTNKFNKLAGYKISTHKGCILFFVFISKVVFLYCNKEQSKKQKYTAS